MEPLLTVVWVCAFLLSIMVGMLLGWFAVFKETKK